eukprot:24986-Chlamydomonas_euryale.AAC.1
MAYAYARMHAAGSVHGLRRGVRTACAARCAQLLCEVERRLLAAASAVGDQAAVADQAAVGGAEVGSESAVEGHMAFGSLAAGHRTAVGGPADPAEDAAAGAGA